MNTRNRIGLYGSYFLCMAGIGFILPYLPLYLRQQGLSDRAIGFVWTLAALAGLLQFPAGVWSDRLRARKPFLLVALALLAVSTFLLHGAHGAVWLGFLAVLFAENGPCRATVESLAGAEAVHLAPPNQVGAALGALRFWRPIGIMAVALAGSVVAGRYGPGSILLPLTVVQALAFVAALFIHEKPAARTTGGRLAPRVRPDSRSESATWRDRSLWAFVAAMVLFHT
ncbi:MAG TPA: MFS transporter, partial [Gemmataceae bacterium]